MLLEIASLLSPTTGRSPYLPPEVNRWGDSAENGDMGAASVLNLDFQILIGPTNASYALAVSACQGPP